MMQHKQIGNLHPLDLKEIDKQNHFTADENF